MINFKATFQQTDEFDQGYWSVKDGNQESVCIFPGGITAQKHALRIARLLNEDEAKASAAKIATHGKQGKHGAKKRGTS